MCGSVVRKSTRVKLEEADIAELQRLTDPGLPSRFAVVADAGVLAAK
jgi:hypothetical protein